MKGLAMQTVAISSSRINAVFQGSRGCLEIRMRKFSSSLERLPGFAALLNFMRWSLTLSFKTQITGSTITFSGSSGCCSNKSKKFLKRNSSVSRSFLPEVSFISSIIAEIIVFKSSGLSADFISRMCSKRPKAAPKTVILQTLSWWTRPDLIISQKETLTSTILSSDFGGILLRSTPSSYQRSMSNVVHYKRTALSVSYSLA